jgi:L-cystine uptake protein TcyP (sodium:dicarboxylate symporter family)
MELWDFETCLWDLCFSGILCDFETSCLPRLSCEFWTALSSNSILWNLEMSCFPLVFCGILKCVRSSNCSYSYSEISGAFLVFCLISDNLCF